MSIRSRIAKLKHIMDSKKHKTTLQIKYRCPFCCSGDLQVENSLHGCFVLCIGCGGAGPIAASQEEAIWKWDMQRVLHSRTLPRM